MVYRGFFVVALVLTCLLPTYLVNGREHAKNGGISAMIQNVSTSYGDKFAQAPFQVNNSEAGPKEVNYWAVFRTMERTFHGAQALLNLYALPSIKQNQVSGIEMWIINGIGGAPEDVNVIQTGWHVHPELYKNHDSRFFVRWTADGYYNTGCYNLDCEGFVLVNTTTMHPGSAVRPVSTYNGKQWFIPLKVSKDPTTGDWWLHHGLDFTEPIGYWPKSLFKSLADSASQIHIGGVVAFRKDDSSPPMGSGHLAREGEGKAASIKRFQLINEDGSLYTPALTELSVFFNSRCHELFAYDRDHLYAGGPGGC